MRILPILMFGLTLASLTLAQNSNSSTTTGRPRTTNTNQAPAKTKASVKPAEPSATPTPASTAIRPATSATQAPGSAAVVAAFEALLNGIRKADVNAVTSVYWNSPRLILFNNNGTVTKGWEQMRKNRESSYPDLKDVKLDVRDLSITMLGRDGAVVNCQWTQSQTFKGTPETASGRMTLVFRRVGKDWKAVHLHTSPDRQDPSRVLPSEESPAPTPSPTPNP
ncbi:MAG: AtzH-like domain-containing protein [Pyrinomonadaceae bacterium]